MMMNSGLSLLHIGSVQNDHAQALCIVRKLSTSHVMIATRLLLEPGMIVRIGLRGNYLLPGQVGDIAGPLVPVLFDRPVNPSDVVEAGKRAHGGQESVRLQLERPVQIVGPRATHLCLSVDISLGGMKIRGVAPWLHIGDLLLVELQGLGRREARLAWIKGNEAGLHFSHTMGYDELDLWLQKWPDACGDSSYDQATGLAEWIGRVNR
ncbi:PilZ domain-containing protein [Sphingobium sp. AR-3-1]|uniref:PilZ domain-containing protein n=1 Tax=Sphingobium psychrophilum TaxID=2728834 RepID=A0A7X9WZH6_9SPHN|nr:PilZ domain-containing protein [Sphingobium psychrophilum]NML12795.1 PilZ domain-containing protein [Sphingobium psychrophilum]